MEPDIRYARNDGVAIAYQVVGDADRDLVFVPDYVSNLVYGWESPYWREFYERLSRSFRLILFDKRGTGLSDRGGAGFAALEMRMDDMRAVLGAAGSERAVVVGGEEGGQMAALYAATHPDATAGLRAVPAACPHRRRHAGRGGAVPRDHEALGDATACRRDAGRQVPDAPAQRGRPRLVRELAPRRRQPRDRARAEPGVRGERRPGRAHCDPRADARPSPHGRDGGGRR